MGTAPTGKVVDPKLRQKSMPDPYRPQAVPQKTVDKIGNKNLTKEQINAILREGESK